MTFAAHARGGAVGPAATRATPAAVVDVGHGVGFASGGWVSVAVPPCATARAERAGILHAGGPCVGIAADGTTALDDARSGDAGFARGACVATRAAVRRVGGRTFALDEALARDARFTREACAVARSAVSRVIGRVDAPFAAAPRATLAFLLLAATGSGRGGTVLARLARRRLRVVARERARRCIGACFAVEAVSNGSGEQGDGGAEKAPPRRSARNPSCQPVEGVALHDRPFRSPQRRTAYAMLPTTINCASTEYRSRLQSAIVVACQDTSGTRRRQSCRRSRNASAWSGQRSGDRQ